MKASNLMVNIASCKNAVVQESLFSLSTARLPNECDIGFPTNVTNSWRCIIPAPAPIIKADSGQNFVGTMLHRKRGQVINSGCAELASETEIGLFPSRRSKNGVENESANSTQQRSRAPAQIFRASHLYNILINIANKISSFGGLTAQELNGGIQGKSNIDAFTGWRIRNNEGKWTTQMTGTTKTTAKQTKTERMQNSGHQQQTMRIQEIAPALLFSAINNHILFGEAKQ